MVGVERLQNTSSAIAPALPYLLYPYSRVFCPSGRALHVQNCSRQFRRTLPYASLSLININSLCYFPSHGSIVTSVKYGRGREIRTPDILLPKQARYQTALYPDTLVSGESRGGEYYAVLQRWSRYYLRLVVSILRMRESLFLHLTINHHVSKNYRWQGNSSRC